MLIFLITFLCIIGAIIIISVCMYRHSQEKYWLAANSKSYYHKRRKKNVIPDIKKREAVIYHYNNDNSQGAVTRRAKANANRHYASNPEDRVIFEKKRIKHLKKTVANNKKMKKHDYLRMLKEYYKSCDIITENNILIEKYTVKWDEDFYKKHSTRKCTNDNVLDKKKHFLSLIHEIKITRTKSKNLSVINIKTQPNNSIILNIEKNYLYDIKNVFNYIDKVWPNLQTKDIKKAQDLNILKDA